MIDTTGTEEVDSYLRTTRRRVLQTTAGAVAAGTVSGRGAAQRASGPTVYIGSDDSKLYAVDAATGSKQWAFKTGAAVRSSPTVVDATVYVCSMDNNLYAVDAATGEKEWALDTGSVGRSSPTVVDGTVYIGSVNLYAVDAAEGTERWAFDTDAAVVSSPTVVDGTVYVGSSGNLYAVDAVTGTKEWALAFDTGNMNSNINLSSPTVLNGTVYVGSSKVEAREDDDTIVEQVGGALYAVDAATGEEEWTFDTGSNMDQFSNLLSPTVVDNTVYFGSDDNKLYALDAGTGEQEWVFDTNSGVGSSPTVYEGTVYVGSFGNLYAVDTGTGKQEWVFNTTDMSRLSLPTVVDNTVYVGSYDNRLYAVDTGTGKQEWVFDTGGSVWSSSPTVVNDPESGDSIGSRVNLGTLGHHHVWADTTPPSDGDVSLTLWSITDATAEAGGTATLRYTLTNEGSTTSTGLQGVVDLPPGNWDLGESDSFTSLGPGERDTASAEIIVPENASGEYTIGGRVTDDADNEASATATITIEEAGEAGEAEFRFTAEASPETVAPGEETTLEFTITNVGDAVGEDGIYAAFFGNEELRDAYPYEQPFEITSRNGDGGGWDGGWLYGGIAPGENRMPSIDVAVAESADLGEYTFAIENIYAEKNPATATVTITVAQDNTPPNAAFTVSPESPTAGDTLTLNASASNDPDGTIETYEWQIGSDDDFTSEGQQFDTTAPPAGDTTITLRVTDDDGATDTTSETVSIQTDAPQIETIDGEPVANATVQLFGKGNYTDTKSEGRIIAERTTNQDGKYNLPTSFDDADEELVLTVQRGDWFATQIFDPTTISTPEDYGVLTLDRQLLYEPTVARAPNGDPFGTVTVWRCVFSDELDVFYTEVTNNDALGSKPWEISEAGAVNGPTGGDFLFSYPDTKASTAQNDSFAQEDPTGSGGVEVLATHPPMFHRCCHSGIGLGDTMKPSPAGFLHPMRDYSGLPLYETTKRLGRLAELEDPPSQLGGWHPITPESSDRVEYIEGRLEEGIKLPAKACDLINISCGPGYLLDALNGLTWVNKVLDGGPRTANINKTPDTPIVGGETPAAKFDAWRSDNPQPFTSSREASVVYQVPLEIDTDDAITCSVQAEWARPYNNRGQFTATFSTGPIDVEMTNRQPLFDPTVSDTYSVNVTLRNRSLVTRTITEVTVSARGKTQTTQLNVELAPGEVVTEPATWDYTTEATGEITVQIEAVDDQGVTATRTNIFQYQDDPLFNIGQDSSFTVSQDTVTAGSEITFDAATSTASDAISDYEWDFDNDGTFETRGQVVSHTFNSAGEYQVRLRLTDTEGETAVVSETVTVTPPESAVAQVDADDDGNIENSERQDAINGWVSGKYSISDLTSIVSEWMN